MKKIFTYFIMPLLFIGLAFVGWKAYQDIAYKSTDKTIQFIREHMNTKGEIVDYNGEIRVESVKDIKLFVTEKQIKIEFGTLTLTWKAKDFTSPETIEKLKRIGIEMYRDKTKRLHVLWNGEEITRWVS